MISLIICSRTEKIAQDLEQNIEETIGTEHELVVINNSKNTYSIFTAYNEGVARAKGDILCFMHEDIIYHTFGWGSVVEEALKNDKIGCLGVVGGHYFYGNTVAWWSGNVNSGEVIQGYYDNNEYKTKLRLDHNFYRGQKTIEVASVDGLWMCLPKKMFNEIRWDSDTFRGFHCYDADICMQVRKLGKEVHVLFNCRIEHKSYGCLNEEFRRNSKIFLNKWASYFPLMVCNEDVDIKALANIVAMHQEQLKNSNRYKEDYYSVLNSKAFRIGNIILKPIQLLRKFLQR